MQAVKIVSKERRCSVYACSLSLLQVTKHCSALWLSGLLAMSVGGGQQHFTHNFGDWFLTRRLTRQQRTKNIPIHQLQQPYSPSHLPLEGVHTDDTAPQCNGNPRFWTLPFCRHFTTQYRVFVCFHTRIRIACIILHLMPNVRVPVSKHHGVNSCNGRVSKASLIPI